jgi:peroxiredoxin
MKSLLYLLCLVFSFGPQQPATLSIGAPAPDFSLPGTDGKQHRLSDYKKSKLLVVVFTCNHCPTAQAYEDRLIQLTRDYQPKGVAVIAISPNDPKAIRLNELDYTDLNDSYEEMKIRAERKQFNFPYLYDGDLQQVSKAYGPVATPHVFIFDQDRKLRFQGRIDNVEKPSGKPTIQDTRAALDALLKNEPVAIPATKVFGCSIKWAEKQDWREKAMKEWAAEKVNLETIDSVGIRKLLQNDSKKLRLINVWATWCGPCTREFPDFITIHRMYRGRAFEFISISADDPEKRANALEFLQQQQASGKNYIFNSSDKYALIEAIDPNWQGALPYTLVVEPGGKIVYAKQGTINPDAIKTLLIDHPLLGRYF